MSRFAVVVAGALAAAGAARADFTELFDGAACDFGAVPRGSLQTHNFWVTNRTEGNVRIAGLRVSCGCVSATALQGELAPGQSTAVVAQMDTGRFSGHRAVTVFVQFDQPRWEEVRLTVQANSRDDLLLIPETLDLGKVKKGKEATGSVRLTILGGSYNVTGAQSSSKFVSGDCQVASRDDGRVTFEVKAKLQPGLAVGNWTTDIWLTTDNPSLPKVRVPVSVEVVKP